MTDSKITTVQLNGQTHLHLKTNSCRALVPYQEDSNFDRNFVDTELSSREVVNQNTENSEVPFFEQFGSSSFLICSLYIGFRALLFLYYLTGNGKS